MSDVKTIHHSSRGASGTHVNADQVTRVVRNTYSLLALTLLTSTVTAALSMALNVGYGASMIMMLGALGLIWFVLPRTANSASGIGVVFGFTALLGASLGPVLNHYLAMANGSMIIMQALGSTAAVFFALSSYVWVTKKDFNFLGGFLFAGLVVAIVGMVALMVASLFGVQISGLMIGFNALIALLMSGFILFDTSRIINGGETNYLMATTALYLDIYNLFTSLLHLIGFAADE